MEPRVIKDYDPSDIDYNFLYESNDWDCIELNYNIDSDSLTEWWKTVKEKFSQAFFTFNEHPELIRVELSKSLVEEGFCGYYCGPIDGITLAWPTERYEPLPPPFQANLDVFPEVNYDTFIDDAKILPGYEFGYFKTLLKEMGRDAFRQAIVTRHYPGMYIKQHRDGKNLKLHIPIESHSNSFFHFGDNRDRKYHFKQGKAYILNTVDWHGTSNDTAEYRSHIIARITQDHILDTIALENV